MLNPVAVNLAYLFGYLREVCTFDFMELSNFSSLAGAAKKSNKELVKRLKKMKSGTVDQLFQQAHAEVFECTDCLKCANCCTTTGPLWTNKDIERIAKHLKMKPGAFIEAYLRIDEEDDYVLQNVPCHFLGADNYCGIYEVRPKACREYPHTDRANQKQILNLAVRNTSVCPAVFEIFEKLKAQLT